MTDISILAGLLVALVFVMGLALWVRKRPRRSQRRTHESASTQHPLEIPDHWLFSRRRITNAAEHEMWRQLRQMFPSHQVMVKLPIARFLMTRDPEQARAWARKLSRVYCTCTVCTEEGHVIGCVDMAGPAGLPQGNLQIKQSLLAQCGISYRYVTQGQQIDPDSLRADFLGLERASMQSESGVEKPPLSNSQLVQQARDRLHETLDRSRGDRHSVQEELENPPSDIMISTSFLTPLESRRAGLDVI
ncbi:MAG: hypothetical protein LBI48_00855 [Burkholderiaceae bacterium]|nr:hypothetical protein [Burkholderiaceae bacterium]